MTLLTAVPDWYILSIVSLLLLGTQRFLYKVAAERNCSTTFTTAVFMGTVTLLSGTVFFCSGEEPGNLSILLSLGLANSVSFALSTLAHMEALKRLPATVTFSLTRLSLVLVIIFSVVYFHEHLSAMQWLGVCLGLTVIVVLTRGERTGGLPKGASRTGLLYVALCIVCGAVAAISSKMAAVSTSKSAFMALSYLLGTGFSLVLERKKGEQRTAGLPKEAIIIGTVMGVLNFLGFYALLTALSMGPLAIIAPLTGMHFVIAIVLSVVIYHEKLTARRVAGIVLTLLTVVLLKMQ